MPATTTYQNGVMKLPTWSPTPSASIPRCTETPTAIAVFTVTNPCTVHWPPLEGMKQANTAPAAAVISGKVDAVETEAARRATRSPTLVNWISPATPA